MLHDLTLTSPIWISIVIGLIALLTAVFAPAGTSRGWVGHLTSLGYLAAIALTALQFGEPAEALALETGAFQQSLVIDHFALGLTLVILIGAMLMSMASVDYLPSQKIDHGEFYALIAFATSGMIGLVMAGDLLTLFVALELMSIPLYILAGFKRDSKFSTESAMKYFIIGSFASAILLMGMAFTYGATGDLSLTSVGNVLANTEHTEIAHMGMLLLIAGFLFKIGAVPMHMWLPDVYEGAPATATGFMAVAVKTASFGVLARVLLTCFGSDAFRFGDAGWENIIAVVAVASMFIGNLSALNQTNLKRVLAYSAIAHTGYLLLALLALPSGDGGFALNAMGAGLVFYLLAYTLANAAAFGVAAAISGGDRESLNEGSYAGLAKRSPTLAFVLLIAILSLLGIPLTAGFMGKLTIFEEVLSTRGDTFVWLVIVAVVNSVISAWYYLRILLVAFMKEEDAADPIRITPSRSIAWSIGIASVATLVVGTLPSKPLTMSKQAGESLALTAVPSIVDLRAPATTAVAPAAPVKAAEVVR